MANDSLLMSLDGFLAQHSKIVRELQEEAQCARWDAPQQAFAECLRRSAEKRFAGAQPAPDEVEAYLRSLHIEDLALACACSEGNEKAWDFFIAHFRQDLRQAARAMLRESGQRDDARAEELADSLYAELYGVRAGADGRRKSLFEYFHGRSKLSTWLRAVLAQKQVDLFRTSGRTVSLDAGEEEGAPREFASRALPSSSLPADPDREMYIARFDGALREALRKLAPRERLLLSCYYVDQMTLAEIGRLLHEHESTVSRQLERLRRALREGVARMLLREAPAQNGRPAEPPLDAAQVELAFEYAVQDWPFDLSQALSIPEQAADPPEE
jgi:RNA polymerase sigma-70 factor (ECF subfamily)